MTDFTVIRQLLKFGHLSHMREIILSTFMLKYQATNEKYEGNYFF